MNNSKLICLVAILKDEEKFIDEWLVYHKMIGINHFFLYEDDPKQVLKKHLFPHADYVTIIDWYQCDESGTKPSDQIGAYTHALRNYIQEFEWVVFLDGDEFIVLRQHLSIGEFLSDFKGDTAISLNWHLFGHNGFYDDPNGLITTSLTRRMLAPFPSTKTITKTAAIDSILSPHQCLLKYGELVDCNHRSYSNEIYEGKTEVAHINHYHCRSFRNWMKRVQRGTASQNAGPHRWRFDEGQCLKRFVTMIARDKNEHIDEYMLKYRFDIHENMNKLNRNRSAFIESSLGKAVILHRLRLIADFLIARRQDMKNIGLFNGGAGVASFLFHYSRLVSEVKYANIALEILEMTDEITEDSPIDITNGLAGYGIAIEHLVEESFIRIDTDELLDDIDMAMRYFIFKIPFSDPMFFITAIEQGEYYLSRYNNPVNCPNYDKDGNNNQYLEGIIEMIRPSPDGKICLRYLDLICKVYLHRDNRDKALESIQKEITDIKSRIDNAYPLFSEFDPVYMAEILLKFSKDAEDGFYSALANDVLCKYENEYWEYLKAGILDDTSKVKIGLRYLNLGKTLDDKSFIEKGFSYLNPILNTENPIMFGNTTNVAPTIMSAFALLLIDQWDDQLYNLASINTASDLKLVH